MLTIPLPGTTQLGKAFLPFIEPVQPHFHFQLSDRLQEINAQHCQKEDAGLAYDSNDEVELEDPPEVTGRLEVPPGSPHASHPSAAQTTMPASWAGLSNKEQKMWLRKRAKRAKEAAPTNSHIKQISAKRVAQSMPTQTGLESETLPITSSGWIGLCPPGVKKEHSLEELLGPAYGMRLENWDGR